ncbi:MAG: hypothetical protein NDI69_11605 [Bacteriovoracaceae bacterium]|nr:hypothetical protein [Bacteriovoracaceae bacterium]
MKKLILAITLLASMAASAGELKVLDLPSSALAHGHVTTRFEINQSEGTAGVSATVTKRRPGRAGGSNYTKTFEKEVPELSMVGGTLSLNVDGVSVVCGTMGVTRIFKRPILNLNGNCDLETRRIRNAEGRRYQLFIKY